nr:MAG TPA: hypothetical protein [Caudoviricetes sp.]
MYIKWSAITPIGDELTSHALMNENFTRVR